MLDIFDFWLKVQGGQQLCMLNTKVGLAIRNCSFDSSGTNTRSWRFDDAAKGRRGESMIELFQTKADFDNCEIWSPTTGAGTALVAIRAEGPG